MRLTEGTFTGKGGIKLFYRAGFPETNPRAAVIMVHGLGDHSGGFQPIQEILLEQGYAVYGFDLRGHGRSSGKRGFIQSWEDYRKDLHAFRRLVVKDFPDLPHYILSHNLGGIIGLDYVIYHGKDIAGLIAISPAISYKTSRTEKIIFAIMGRMKPDYKLNNRQRYDLLTQDPLMIEKLKTDELRHSFVTPGLGKYLLKTLKVLDQKAASIQIPVLFQFGLDDEITPQEKVHQYFETVSSKDKQLLDYENMRHRPFDDLEREVFLNDLVTWLNYRSCIHEKKL
ncbi:alpha/beta hydrolase [Oceanobacillus senegalensis]|uniref:alpha/beta hydrolase n=1 Tax=Oceanobacillus senegalensis TaxID=1936063 RepID=UPI0015C4D81F|nr:alpha/beta hydrolase [Oceanobacillus senegalensis]